MRHATISVRWRGGGQGGAKDPVQARDAYRRGCEAGLLKSCGQYGALLKDGLGGPADPAEALGPLGLACKAGEAGACYNQGQILYFGDAGERRFEDARTAFAGACPGYAADGCYALGVMKRDGQGGAVDTAGANKAFSIACENGNAEGCIESGVGYYDNGQFAEARDQFAQACNNGAAGGCMNAGMMYRDGTGGRSRSRQSEALFHQWMQAGYPGRLCHGRGAGTVSVAAGLIGAFALKLRRTGLIFALAAVWSVPSSALPADQGAASEKSAVERACEAGDLAACLNAGRILVQLSGEARAIRARDMFARGCELGSADACHLLVPMLIEGRGGCAIARCGG